VPPNQYLPAARPQVYADGSEQTLARLVKILPNLPIRPLAPSRLTFQNLSSDLDECADYINECQSANFNRFKKRRIQLLLLHPVWEAQMWWPHITTQRRKFINVGTFAQVFTNLSVGLRTQNQKPSWRFQIL
jgi:hypothetical protein